MAKKLPQLPDDSDEDLDIGLDSEDEPRHVAAPLTAKIVNNNQQSGRPADMDDGLFPANAVDLDEPESDGSCNSGNESAKKAQGFLSVRKTSNDPENEPDFKKAYEKLANRGSPSKRGKEEGRSFAGRIQSKKEVARMNKLIQELDRKEQEECTFAPKTLRKTEKRKLDDFLNDQRKHVERHREMVKKLAEKKAQEEMKGIVMQPAINVRSRELAKGKTDKEPVHERLFAKRKKEIAIPKPEVKKVKMQEGTARQLELYDEAKKRQERLMELQKKEAEEFKANIFSREYTKNPYIQQKFAKDFNASLPPTSAPLLTFSQTSKLHANL